MNESKVGNISVRAVLAVIIVGSCCGLAIWTKDMTVLKDLALVAVSFYFGQKSISNPPIPPNTNTTIASTTEAPKS